MPKLSLIFGSLALSAMTVGTPAGAMQVSRVGGVLPGHTCRTLDTNRFIGKSGSATAGAAIRHATGAAILRWAPPGTMLTMDYRVDRVTVYLDRHKTITRITCG